MTKKKIDKGQEIRRASRAVLGETGRGRKGGAHRKGRRDIQEEDTKKALDEDMKTWQNDGLDEDLES